MTEKYLWEVTYKVMYNNDTFKVITSVKDISQVAKVCNQVFDGTNNHIEDIQNIQYIGEVFE